MHLFLYFLLLGASVFMLASFLFCQHQARETAQILINESLKVKFVAIERYVFEFFKLHEQRLDRVTSHPVVKGATLEGVSNSEAFSDQVSLLKGAGASAYINLSDFPVNLIFKSKLPQIVEDYVVSGVETETLMEGVSYSFFGNNEIDYLLLTSPVLYNGYAEGLVTYTTPVAESNFFESLGTDTMHWFGIAQDEQLADDLNAWQVDMFPIEGSELSLALFCLTAAGGDAEIKPDPKPFRWYGHRCESLTICHVCIWSEGVGFTISRFSRI